MDPNPPQGDPTVYNFDPDTLSPIRRIPVTADAADTAMMPAIRDEEPPTVPPEAPPLSVPKDLTRAPAQFAPPSPPQAGVRRMPPRPSPPPRPGPPTPPPPPPRRPQPAPQPVQDEVIDWPQHYPDDPLRTLETSASPGVAAAFALRVAEELERVYTGQSTFAELHTRAQYYRHQAAALTARGELAYRYAS